MIPNPEEPDDSSQKVKKVDVNLHKMMKNFQKKIQNLNDSMKNMREDAEELAKYFEYSN